MLLVTQRIKAILLQPVSLKGSVIFPEGSEILVDVQENIGYVDGFHFDVSEHEYKPIYLN